MNKIISIFTRSGGFLVFLILEAICIGLVVTYNAEQKDIYKNTVNIFSDGITSNFGQITQYYNLSAVNDSLAGVIADLRTEQDNARFYNLVRGDSLKEEMENFTQQYSYVAAKVTSNTISLPNNFLTLNRGLEHGINTRMGVFDDKGIIGIVVGSNSKYSRVMSILHRDSKISAEIKRLGAFGSLVWENTANPTMMELRLVPKHIEPIVGDTIQTNGYSTHFPKGIMIGTIHSIEKNKGGSNFHGITVKLSNDLSTVQYGYIVKNLFKTEQLEIEEGEEDE